MPPAKYRLLLAIGIYEPDRGGAAEWLRHYAEWLAGRGHDVSVVCEQAFSPAPAGCRLLTLPSDQHTKNSWKRAVALQKLVGQAHGALVHDTGCLLESDVFHPLMGSLSHNWQRQLRAYPWPLRLRRFFHVRRWRDVRLQRHQNKHHRLLIACSPGVAADFAQVGCREVKIISNGIPLPVAPASETVSALREKLGVGDRLLVLVTATNFYLKGVMTVLRALNHLEAATRKKFLVIVTGHNPGGPFQRHLELHQLGDCCRLAGWVEDVADYYHAADIFLHPTYHDAGSLSTLKALASGCAVVTSRFDGSAQMITHGTSGFVIQKPGDACELANLLRQLLDTSLRERLGAAARALAPGFSQERQFQQLEAVYGEISVRTGSPKQV